MSDREAKNALFDAFAEVAKALASGRRAEIVDVLAQGERSVDEIAGEIDQSVANTSHHLHALTRAGLLSSRREGTRVFYALASDRVGELWAAVRDVAAEHVAGIERLAVAYLGDRDDVEAITREELASRLRRRNVVVIDVRPTAEYAAGHIPGAVGAARRGTATSPHDPQRRRDRRVLPRPVLRLRRRCRENAPTSRHPGPAPRGRIPGMEACRPRHRGRRRRRGLMARVDVDELRDKVKVMYRAVAEAPQGEFHFEMGRVLAQRLGYPSGELDAVPPEAIESFAGVGYHLGLAAIAAGERVVDLGSGSGMDAFLAAQHAGTEGEVVGIDMTDEQLTKARRLAERDGHTSVRFEKGYIEDAPVADASVDVLISNGVINLCDDKTAVFREIARMLKPGGRMAISDIVTERQLTEAIVCDVNLWASCIGGAMQEDDYRRAIEDAGLELRTVQDNPQYHFISDSAQGATETFGVKSVSVLATKPPIREEG